MVPDRIRRVRWLPPSRADRSRAAADAARPFRRRVRRRQGGRGRGVLRVRHDGSRWKHRSRCRRHRGGGARHSPSTRCVAIDDGVPTRRCRRSRRGGGDPQRVGVEHLRSLRVRDGPTVPTGADSHRAGAATNPHLRERVLEFVPKTDAVERLRPIFDAYRTDACRRGQPAHRVVGGRARRARDVEGRRQDLRGRRRSLSWRSRWLRHLRARTRATTARSSA